MRGRRVRLADAFPTPSQPRGAALVEMLAAVTLVAIAAAGLAATAAATAIHTRLERETAAALWLALGRLEAQRGQPPGSGSERTVLAEGTTIDSTWLHEDGRGLPARATIATRWRDRVLVFDTEIWP